MRGCSGPYNSLYQPGLEWTLFETSPPPANPCRPLAQQGGEELEFECLARMVRVRRAWRAALSNAPKVSRRRSVQRDSDALRAPRFEPVAMWIGGARAARELLSRPR